MPRPSRKQALLDAGIASVLSQGATQTTVEAVCGQVGVTKGAFFHHFADKDAFVAAMLEHFGERGAAALAALEHPATETPAAHLHAYLSALERIYATDPWFRQGCLFLIVAQEYEGDTAVRQQCEQGLERWIDLSTAAFRRVARHAGHRPRVSERQLAEQLLFTIEGALHVGRARGVRGSIRRALQQFERYACDALHIDFPVDKP